MNDKEKTGISGIFSKIPPLVVVNDVRSRSGSNLVIQVVQSYEEAPEIASGAGERFEETLQMMSNHQI